MTQRTRAIAKTGTYASMHMIVAIAVAYVLSGSWQIALGIGIVEPIVQTFAYNIHERFWQKHSDLPPQPHHDDIHHDEQSPVQLA